MTTTKKIKKSARLDREIAQALGSGTSKKLWVVCTDGYVVDVCGLAETEARAKSAIWDKLQSTNFFGYGIPAGVTSARTFFEQFGTRSYQLASGEAVAYGQ